MNARRRNSSRKGFPENLYCKADGYFWYRNPGSGKTKGLGRDRATAFREARNANAALANLQKSSLADWVTGKPQNSLADWLPVYETLWVEREKPAKSTIAAMKRYVKHIADADFAWMNLAEISAQHVAKFLDDAEKARSPSIALNLRTRLSDIFRMVSTQGHIDKNPVAVTYAPDYQVKRDRLSLEQFKAIRDKAPIWLTNAMNLALLTGQRREDITLMKFSDVREGHLHVVQSKSQGSTRLRIDIRVRLVAAGMSIDDVVKQCRDKVVASTLCITSRRRRRTRLATSSPQRG